MLGRLLALALVSASATLTARARTTGPTNDSLDNAWLRHQINGRALIRVRGVWGSADLSRPQLAGRTLSYAETTFPGTTSLALPRSLSLETINRIQVRGNAAGTGALVGGGVGLLGGLAMSLALTSTLCNDALGCSNAVGGTVVITLGAAVGGTLLGALIGSTIKKWKTIYPPS